MQNNAAAIILCAGKGTRMNDDSKNKVCFECAGIPVIKRIVDNMRKGGITKFVVVVGHKAQSVMDCLDGEPGVIYTYQKEQRGTGHAALCGLKALETAGYSGPAVISMGDKIIAPDVIASILEKAMQAPAVWSVQPVETNYNGGRVVIHDDKPYGIVEFSDAAFMSLYGLPEEQYEEKLTMLCLNEKKIQKVLRIAKEKTPFAVKRLIDRDFTAEEILSTPYANAGLYCFNVDLAIKTISTFTSANTQGEIYITDALERFSADGVVVLYEIKNADDMLTYSTKPELRHLGLHFMRSASELKADIDSGSMDNEFLLLYSGDAGNQKKRYLGLLNWFIHKFGDKKVVVTRSPGRINLMGRHIDHRGGGINVMATDKDTVIISSPRDDDIVNITNVNYVYPDQSFTISALMGKKNYDSWLDFLDDPCVKAELEASRGDWSNYVKSAIARVQFENEMPLCGMDMVTSGNIPVAAGLSSSSSIVVATMEAVVSMNCLNYSERQFVELCGEGEWFVGSRGGAGDHAAMKCGKAGSIVHIGFKPFEIGNHAAFLEKYAVLVANSMIRAKKSEGSRDKFNSKVAAYEIAFMILKHDFPNYDLREFRDIAKIRPYSRIYEMLKSLPETITRGGARALLPEYKEQLERLFSTHADPIVYELRGVALYGISECVRAERFMDLLDDSDYKSIGEMMKTSHNGDRIRETDYSDRVLDRLISENADVALQSGSYGCSLSRIDELCDLLDSTEGVLGSELVGAGLGGCVIALVEKEKAPSIIQTVNEEYYDKYGLDRSADVFTAAAGSSVMF